MPASANFAEVLFTDTKTGGIFASAFVQAVEGCYGRLRTQPHRPFLLSSIVPEFASRKIQVRFAYDIARGDRTPLDRVPDRLIAIRIPEMADPIYVSSCAIAASFSRTELATGSRARVRTVNLPKPSTSKVRILESEMAITKQVKDFIMNKSKEIVPPMLSIFFNEAQPDAARVTGMRASDTSCRIIFHLDLKRLWGLQKLTIGAYIKPADAKLENQKPYGVVRSDFEDGDPVTATKLKGKHYPQTVAAGHSECKGSCDVSWELTGEALTIPGSREFGVDVKDLKYTQLPKIEPFLKLGYLIQTLSLNPNLSSNCH